MGKKKIYKDCWDLDQAFLKWLGKRLPVYLESAEKIVDLEESSITFRGKNYTQKEIIIKMIEILNEIEETNDTWNEDYPVLIDELLDLWRVVFLYMWW